MRDEYGEEYIEFYMYPVLKYNAVPKEAEYLDTKGLQTEVTISSNKMHLNNHICRVYPKICVNLQSSV